MDPLDIMANLDKVCPYYQAIFNAEKQEVMGYEVLGRIQLDNKEVESLGPFFHDYSIPLEYQSEVEKVVINKALTYYTENSCSFKLFLNQNVHLLLQDQGESLLELLLSFVPKGLNLENIVIEIDEHSSKEDIEYIQHIFNYYKTYGIQLAIANIGEAGANMDRIRRLSPNIMKVDLRMLRQSYEVTSHQDVLYSLAILSRKIGAALLYENIDASFQLQYAWRNGGQYYQGEYLHQPGPDFIQILHAKKVLIEKFQQFIRYEKRKLQAIHHFSQMLDAKIHSLPSKDMQHDEIDSWLLSLAKQFTDISFRMYVCDENGFQLSSNLFKEEGIWKTVESSKGKNWSWRPYFLENVMKMSIDQKGILSDLYSDIKTGESVRTYSYPISRGRFLYMDLAYEFLYENQDLL
ncbi:EAL domain-containing protein [Sutcliffiella rhizosphaerae]|uniref:EAL-domain containing protein YkuI n=1 Tax=Sutcliffiella rhizosphaerae TaxID=2880967 RepID=A0ABN8A976_9BACI|nr:EAL-associated domain-containing protein [Sutcliffiella rhizosphaerae]CAG9619912.1 putative EAL-domain containing protein YkuI [Sutcliffiella rhizosphaerae]